LAYSWLSTSFLVLALGCLFTRGVIASRDDVAGICTDAHGVHVRLRRLNVKFPTDPRPRNAVLPRGDPLPLASIQGWVRQMFDRTDLRREIGGGMHSAGLADHDGLRCVYEDVGRHNAVDKAIAAGVPIFASRSIPTTTAHEMGVRIGMTLIGCIASDAPVVYTGSERLF
jgi:formate dehydrogenase assembly factor FdhD